MSSSQRRLDSGLVGQLIDEPYRFEFFQAVRLLEQHWLRTRGKSEAAGVHIRFRNSKSLSFPASEIESIDTREFDTRLLREQESGNEFDAFTDSTEDCLEEIEQVIITPAIMGLIGPSGVLPRHYTHAVADRERYHRDTATRTFLDIFANRALTLFYRAWRKNRIYLEHERQRRSGLLSMVLNVAGLRAIDQSATSVAAMAVDPESLGFYAGVLQHRPQSAQVCARVLSDFFGVPCQVRQFVGQWFDVPEESLTQLGTANAQLGADAFCGERLWERATKLDIVIGPVRKRRFEEFLPRGPAQRKLRELVSLTLGLSYQFEVRLVLDKRDAVPVQLGGAESPLGWSGWLLTRDAQNDAHDTAYLLNEVA